MHTRDAIPGLIICNSGYVTKVTRPDEIEELEEKAKGKQTTTAKPELITFDAGHVTRVGGKLIRT